MIHKNNAMLGKLYQNLILKVCGILVLGTYTYSALEPQGPSIKQYVL